MIKKEDILKDKITIIKNFPSRKEQSDFWYFANESDYSYGQNSDSHMSERQGRFTHHFDPEAFVLTSFWKLIEETVDTPLGLSEAYINYGDSATLTFPHCDNREDNMSILLCLNQDWHRNWGGFTSFFNGVDGNDIIETVVPEPGKAVFFNGSMYHLATPCNISAGYPRFMLALKTVWLDKGEEKKK